MSCLNPWLLLPFVLWLLGSFLTGLGIGDKIARRDIRRLLLELSHERQDAER